MTTDEQKKITGATGTPVDGPLNLCDPPEDNNPTEHHHPENVDKVKPHAGYVTQNWQGLYERAQERQNALQQDAARDVRAIEAVHRRHALTEARIHHEADGQAADVADTANTFYAFLSGEGVMPPERPAPREYTPDELFIAARQAVKENPLAAFRYGLSYTNPVAAVADPYS